MTAGAWVRHNGEDDGLGEARAAAVRIEEESARLANSCYGCGEGGAVAGAGDFDPGGAGDEHQDVVRLLERVKSAARGMLPLPVYERLFHLAQAAPGGTFVEVGTAQGAATIALALGAQRSGRQFHIYTVDPFDRGSRRSVGSIEENIALVRRGFEAFGVDGNITLTAGRSSDLLPLIADAEIDILLLDADGCIDRDIELFFDRLSPSCSIVIDDIDGAVYAHRDGGRWAVDLKHRLSHLLASAFCKLGMLVPTDRIAQTGFYRKGVAGVSRGEAEAAALAAYRQLVYSWVEPGQIGLLAAARRLLRKFPRVRMALHAARRRRGGPASGPD